MRQFQSALLAVAISLGITSAAANGALLKIDSVFQTWGYSYNDGVNPISGGGGADSSLPLVNYDHKLDLDPGIAARAKQTITQYVGPAALNQGADSLWVKVDAATSIIHGGATATTSLELKFTLDFGENYSFTRTVSTGGTAKLLFQGLNNTTEIAPGTGVLGKGSYILQIDISGNRTASVDLRIPQGAPEPASAGLLLSGAALVFHRRRRPPCP